MNVVEAILSEDAKVRNPAVRALHQQCYPKIKSYILQNSGSAEDAEDVYQEGMMVFYDNVSQGKFKEESTCETYIFSICRNLWMGHLRSRKKGDHLLSELAPTAGVGQEPQINLTRLHVVFEELKEDCRKLLIGFYYERKSLHDLMLAFNQGSEQAVKNKKGRCLKYLMRIIEEHKLTKASFYYG